VFGVTARYASSRLRLVTRQLARLAPRGRVGSEEAEVSDEVRIGRRDQRREPPEKLEGLKAEGRHSTSK